MDDVRQYSCPVEATIDVIGGKWKPLILFYLMQRTLRFSELKRHIPGVTQRMLTKHLRELEAAGIVHREVYPVVPPRVEYSLTEFGQSLQPVLDAMVEWGIQYAEAHPERFPNPIQGPPPTLAEESH